MINTKYNNFSDIGFTENSNKASITNFDKKTEPTDRSNYMANKWLTKVIDTEPKSANFISEGNVNLYDYNRQTLVNTKLKHIDVSIKNKSQI